MAHFRQRVALVPLLCFTLTTQDASAILRGTSSRFDRLRPYVTAQLLAHVEEDWEDQAIAFDECVRSNQMGNATKDCGTNTMAFTHSCSKTVQAVVTGSDGSKSIAEQYLGDVCSQVSSKGWYAERCSNFTSALLSSMTDSVHNSLEAMNIQQLCGGLWQRVLGHERAVRRQQAEQKSNTSRVLKATEKQTNGVKANVSNASVASRHREATAAATELPAMAEPTAKLHSEPKQNQSALANNALEANGNKSTLAVCPNASFVSCPNSSFAACPNSLLVTCPNSSLVVHQNKSLAAVFPEANGNNSALAGCPNASLVSCPNSSFAACPNSSLVACPNSSLVAHQSLAAVFPEANGNNSALAGCPNASLVSCPNSSFAACPNSSLVACPNSSLVAHQSLAAVFPEAPSPTAFTVEETGNVTASSSAWSPVQHLRAIIDGLISARTA